MKFFILNKNNIFVAHDRSETGHKKCTHHIRLNLMMVGKYLPQQILTRSLGNRFSISSLLNQIFKLNLINSN